MTGLAFDNVDDVAAASRTVGACVAMLSVAVVVFVVYVADDRCRRLLEVRRSSPTSPTRLACLSGGRFQGAPARRCLEPAGVARDALRRTSGADASDTRGFKGVLGTVLGIDRSHLVRLRQRARLCDRAAPTDGWDLPTGGPVFAVHGDSRPRRCRDAGLSRPGAFADRLPGSDVRDPASWSTSPPRPCPRRSTSRPPRCRSSTASRTSSDASEGSLRPPGSHVDTNGAVNWSARTPSRRRTSSTSRSRESRPARGMDMARSRTPGCGVRRCSPPPHPKSGILQSRDCRGR